MIRGPLVNRLNVNSQIISNLGNKSLILNSNKDEYIFEVFLQYIKKHSNNTLIKCILVSKNVKKYPFYLKYLIKKKLLKVVKNLDDLKSIKNLENIPNLSLKFQYICISSLKLIKTDKVDNVIIELEKFKKH